VEVLWLVAFSFSLSTLSSQFNLPNWFHILDNGSVALPLPDVAYQRESFHFVLSNLQRRVCEQHKLRNGMKAAATQFVITGKSVI